MEETTIAALATPPGRAGLAVIRVSGPDAERILRGIFVPADPRTAFSDRVMMYGKAAFQGRVLDELLSDRAPAWRTLDVTVLHGRVSNIERASDVAGVYGAAGAGIAVGSGARAMVLTNQKGAVLELTGKQTGLMANADLSGLAITLK